MMQAASVIFATAFAPTPLAIPRPVSPAGAARTAPGGPQALLPKAIVPFFFIPTYVQIGYAIEAKFRDGKGPFTRLIKSDAVQKGPGMKRMKKEAPKVRGQRLTPEAAAVASTFQREYDAKELETVWGALVKVYGSKERANAAVAANPQVLNPSYSFCNTILESKRVLTSVMSEAEALEVMRQNPAVLQCGPSLDLFGTDEIKMIASMREMGNAMVPPVLRPALVGLLVGGVALTVVTANGVGGPQASPELEALVGALKPLLGASLGATFLVAAYGAASSGRKGPEQA